MTDSNQHEQIDDTQVIDSDQITLIDDQPPIKQCLKKTSWKFELLILVVCAGVIFASFFLKVDKTSMVVIPYLEIQTPGTCPTKSLFGIDCPGCGLTRGMIFIAHGQFANAWQLNPATFLIGVVIFFQIPLRTYNLYQIRRNSYFSPLSFPVWLAWVVVGSLIVQWSLRMIW